MTIKTRFIIFFVLLIFLTPSIYFYGLHLLFQREPLDISLYEHIGVYNSLMDKTIDPKLRLVIIVSFLFPFLALLKTKGVKGEHGNASFATKSTIKKMELFEKQGVILGTYKNEKLIYKEFLASLVLAPPGTGKTAGVSIPNLLTYTESTFNLDVKGELFHLTSKHREKNLGNKIYRFNPASYDTLNFNPLDANILDGLEWYQKENIADEVAILIYPKPESGDSFWVDSARNIFNMFALYLIFKNGSTSIPDVRELLISNFSSLYEDEESEDELEALKHFVQNEIIEDESLNIRIKELGTGMLRMETKVLSSVIASTMTPLEIFSTSTVRECFRTNDLNILNFRKEKSSLYITIEEKDLTRFATILRMFIEFNLRQLLSNEPKKTDFSMLLLLDEFPRFGKIPYLVDVPELGRSYKLITLLIAQDYGQIEEVYGKSKISRINTSTAYKVIFPQTNSETAEATSKYIGDFTRETASESKSAGDKGNTNKSISTQLSGQALISKQDILNMNDGQIYILAKNFYKHPIKAKPYLYFKDKKLSKLVQKEED